MSRSEAQFSRNVIF